MTYRRLPKPFTPSELRALEAAARPDVAATMVLLAETGLRSAEACSITSDEALAWPQPPRWCFRAGCRRHSIAIRVIGKGSKERIVPLSPTAIRAAKVMLAHSHNGHLIPWSDRGLRYVIAEVGKKAGVTPAHPHRFRHTFATELVSAGLPVDVVADLMGHSSINTTRLYFLTSEKRAIQAIGVRRRSLLHSRAAHDLQR